MTTNKTNTNITQTQTLNTILQTLNKLEIKGSDNVLVMYNLISFIYQEINRFEESNKTTPTQEE